MIVKCFAKDCIYNSKNVCIKAEIEVHTVNTYDNNSAECIDYYIKKSNEIKCWCCNNRNVVKGIKCCNCGEIV